MKEVSYESTLFDIDDAILNEEFTGFKEDYLILHSLIRKYKPKTFFEIGTNMGTGTNIICHAMNLNFWLENKMMFDWQVKDKVLSLDLPTELAHISLQHPISEGKGDKVGINCKFPYTQLRGDSQTFDFSKYPCEGYFCDGEHTYKNVLHETIKMVLCEPKIIIYHDFTIPEVSKAILHFMNHFAITHCQLFVVAGTRIAYLIRTNIL